MSPEAAAAQAVRDRIAAAAERAGRDPSAITLVAASKGIDPDRIRAAGVTDVGENRAQELLAKQAALADAPIRWHFIGALQANKVKAVAGRVALIHSVDDAALGSLIGRRATAEGATQDVLVEVNLSGEPSKAGCSPDGLADLLAGLRESPGLAVRGLMTVPAPGSSEARNAFRRLTELREANGLEHCSMGMTGDFEIAISEGATIVRVGTAIFGPRPA
jgi:PLP dependent protein